MHIYIYTYTHIYTNVYVYHIYYIHLITYLYVYREVYMYILIYLYMHKHTHTPTSAQMQSPCRCAADIFVGPRTDAARLRKMLLTELVLLMGESDFAPDLGSELAQDSLKRRKFECPFVSLTIPRFA